MGQPGEDTWHPQRRPYHSSSPCLIKSERQYCVWVDTAGQGRIYALVWQPLCMSPHTLAIGPRGRTRRPGLRSRCDSM